MLRLRGQYPSAPADMANDDTPGDRTYGTFLKFLKGEIVYDQGDPATHWYEVINGTIRTCFLYSSGHRQLTGFFYAGDVFGIEAGNYQSSAEAVTNVTLRRIDRSRHAQDIAARHNPAQTAAHVSAVPAGAVSANTISATTVSANAELASVLPAYSAAGGGTFSSDALESALSNAQACIFLLGHRTAPERMAAFLLATSRRMGAQNAVALPMSRADIADHLGLTIHTVSRTLSDFVRRALIVLDSPQSIHILDRTGLMRVAGRSQDDQDIPRFKPMLRAPANHDAPRIAAYAPSSAHGPCAFSASPRN
jgi:CRP/FNR family transcriptional regulator, nitrogen fixation regulation protein